MVELAEILPERIKARLDALGKSKRGLSLEIGANAGYVRDLFDPERFNVPSAARMQSLAEALETSTEYLLGKTENASPVLSEVSLADRHFEWRGPTPDEPGIPVMGTGDCAELQLCAVSGEMVAVERTSFDSDFPVRFFARPPALRGARDIYAIYYQGESMVPRFEPGEVGVVDPRRPAAPGDYVVVQLREDESDEVAIVLVKRLVRQNSKELILEQFNPPISFIVPRRQVVRLHRIIPQTELLF